MFRSKRIRPAKRRGRQAAKRKSRLNFEQLCSRVYLAGDTLFAVDIGVTENGDSDSVSPTTTHPNLIGSDLHRGAGADYGDQMYANTVGGLTVRGASADRTHFLSSHLATESEAIADDAYFEWSIEPTAGSTLSIESVTFNVFLQRSPSNGDAVVGLYYLDTNLSPVRVGNTQSFSARAETVTVDASDVAELQGVTEPLTLRIYGWNGNDHWSDKGLGTRSRGVSASGDDLIVTGTIDPLVVDPTNDPPTAIADNYSSNEDEELSVLAALGVLANDTDANDDPLVASLISGPTNGALTLHPDGSFDYVPDQHFNGQDSFRYSANDGTIDSNIVTVVIDVASVNDPPQAVDDAGVFTSLDTDVLEIDVLANDFDVDNDPIFVSQASAGNGQVTIGPNDRLTYSPDPGFLGIDTVVYTIVDPGGLSNTATFTVNVSPVTVVVETLYAIDIGNTEFGASAAATPTVLHSNVIGSSLQRGPGSDYGEPMYSGTYGGLTVRGGSADRTHFLSTHLTSEVDAIADDAYFEWTVEPTLGNQISIDEVSFNVFLQRSTANGDAAVALYLVDQNQTPIRVGNTQFFGERANTITIDTQAFGELQNFTTPKSLRIYGWNGNDHWSDKGIGTRSRSDASIGNDLVVTGSVQPVLSGLTAVPDEFVASEDMTLSVTAAQGVLANDFYTDSGTLMASVLDGPTNGALTLLPDGSFDYQPISDFNGTDEFTYGVSDGVFFDNTTVSITVLALNDDPIAVDDDAGGDEDSLITGNLAANDSDPDSILLTYAELIPPDHGVLVLNGDGTFQYTPQTNYFGTDRFSYEVLDGDGGRATAIANLTIAPINDTPVAEPQSVFVDEDNAISITLTGTDVESGPLTFALEGSPTGGTLSGTAPNLLYTPDANFVGDDTFTFTVTDNEAGTSEPATVSISINAVNDPPIVAIPLPDQTVGEGSLFSFAVPTGTFTDIDDTTLLFSVTGLPSWMSLNPTSNAYEGTPASGDVGGTITVTATDSGGLSISDDFDLTVTSENSPPTASDDDFTVERDMVLLVGAPGLLANDIDTDSTLAVNPIAVTEPENGSLILGTDGNFTYAPNPGFSGNDSFTYQVNDGVLTDTAIVNISVVVVNKQPIANDDTIAITFGQTYVFTDDQLLGNDIDPDLDELTIVAVADPEMGTVELRDGLVWFTPTPHTAMSSTSHQRSFRYTVSDGAGGADTAMVTLIDEPSPHAGAHDGERLAEHDALFAGVVARDSATAIAVRSGNWSDPNTWNNQSVPTDGDRVLVHPTVTVTYDVVSDLAYTWIRNDGVLNFSETTDTRLLAETIASAPGSTFTIGNDTNPILASATTEIVIDTRGGAIDVADDPTQISRGVILHGTTNIFGAEKASFTSIASDAFSGDDFIDLADPDIPNGWQVGDILLLAGTHTDTSLEANEFALADANNERFHDELLQVTSFESIAGTTRVRFTNLTNESAISAGMTTLLWDHVRPDGATFDADELTIHVANLSRNVVIRSSDPSVDTQQRGHFMVMHNTNANIHRTQFKDLGRTDKTIEVDDPIAVGNFDGTPGTGTNPRGRYGLHLHRAGASSLAGTAAEVSGNVVWGTPGWGIVQHDSHANLSNNVVFDTAGAGIVAEDGNEIGIWSNNLSIKSTGDGSQNFDDGAILNSNRGSRFDLGFSGSGYWLQGGGFGIRLENNVAASVNVGIDVVHHIDELANVELISVDLIADPAIRQRYIDAGISVVTPNNVPTRGIDGFVAYNARRGIHTWLHNRDSSNFEGTVTFGDQNPQDYRSIIENYKLWNVRQGVQNFYSAQFEFRDGLIVGNVDDPINLVTGNDFQSNNAVGTAVSSNTGDAHDLHFDGLRVEGFTYGFAPNHSEPLAADQGAIVPFAASSLRNAQFANVDYAFVPSADAQLLGFSDLFVIENVTSDTNLVANNLPPVADFSFTLDDGRIINLDASSSLDPDPGPRVVNDGIVAFAWDIDGDGDFNDAFGETTSLRFPTAGLHSVSLKVWDDHGQSQTKTVQVDVLDSDTRTPFVNGDFDSASLFNGDGNRLGLGARSSAARGRGWIETDFTLNASGYAAASFDNSSGGRILAQVIRDDYLRWGTQVLSFDLNSIDADLLPNQTKVSLYGIDGEWQDRAISAPDPTGIGTVNAVTNLIFQTEVGDLPNGWQGMSFEFDIPSGGYEYLYLRFDVSGVRTFKGDALQIDNVNLVGLESAPLAASFVQTLTTNTETPLPTTSAQTIDIASRENFASGELSLPDEFDPPSSGESALILDYLMGTSDEETEGENFLDEIENWLTFDLIE